MAHYTIRITEFGGPDNSQLVNAVCIELESPYTLVRDLSEWVKEEVDPNAQFIDITPEIPGESEG